MVSVISALVIYYEPKLLLALTKEKSLPKSWNVVISFQTKKFWICYKKQWKMQLANQKDFWLMGKLNFSFCISKVYLIYKILCLSDKNVESRIFLQISTWEISRCCIRTNNFSSWFDYIIRMQTGMNSFDSLFSKKNCIILMIHLFLGDNGFTNYETCFWISGETSWRQWNNY